MGDFWVSARIYARVRVCAWRVCVCMRVCLYAFVCVSAASFWSGAAVLAGTCIVLTLAYVHVLGTGYSRLAISCLIDCVPCFGARYYMRLVVFVKCVCWACRLLV